MALDSVHLVKDFFALALYGNSDSLTYLIKVFNYILNSLG